MSMADAFGANVFLTKSGLDNLEKELGELKKVKLPKLVKRVALARDNGDLSENAEYDAAKEKQALLESRIAQLTDFVGRAQVIDPTTLKHDRVCFGSSVLVLNTDTDEEISYTVVGAMESDPTRGYISYNTPLAKALMGKEEGEVVVITLPNGASEFEILSVEYKEISF